MINHFSFHLQSFITLQRINAFLTLSLAIDDVAVADV